MEALWQVLTGPELPTSETDSSFSTGETSGNSSGPEDVKVSIIVQSRDS